MRRTKSCERCGREYDRPRDYANDQWESRRFCTQKCAQNKGVNGRTRYRRVSTPDGRKMMLHRYVMEQMIGRPLTTGEHVHHRNGITTDNRPANLELISPAAHAKLHNQKYPLTEATPWKERTCMSTSTQRAGPCGVAMSVGVFAIGLTTGAGEAMSDLMTMEDTTRCQMTTEDGMVAPVDRALARRILATYAKCDRLTIENARLHEGCDDASAELTALRADLLRYQALVALKDEREAYTQAQLALCAAVAACGAAVRRAAIAECVAVVEACSDHDSICHKDDALAALRGLGTP